MTNYSRKVPGVRDIKEIKRDENKLPSRISLFSSWALLLFLQTNMRRCEWMWKQKIIMVNWRTSEKISSWLWVFFLTISRTVWTRDPRYPLKVMFDWAPPISENFFIQLVSIVHVFSSPLNIIEILNLENNCNCK